MTETTDLQAVADDAPGKRPVPRRDAREPRRRRARLAARDDGGAAPARQGRRDVHAGEHRVPQEYTFMRLDGLVRELPADVGERVLVAVDCAKADRIGPDLAPVERAKLVVDIDHHHDNTRFGSVNLIVSDASSTGEVLRDVFAELGVRSRRRSPSRCTSRSSPTPAASSTRTRRRSRCGSRQSSSRPAPTCTRCSSRSTSRSSSRS